jgi:hypothetical protein
MCKLLTTVIKSIRLCLRRDSSVLDWDAESSLVFPIALDIYRLSPIHIYVCKSVIRRSLAVCRAA